MKYFKRFKGKEEITEVTKEKARDTLEGYWKEKFLDDIFGNNKSFRLETSFSEVWTESDDGLVPVAGFYGVVE